MIIGETNVVNPSLSSLTKNFGLWQLIGKTLAMITDARLGGNKNQAVITGAIAEHFRGRRHHQRSKTSAPVTTRLLVRFVMLSNELPALLDASGALASRYIILPFPEDFRGRENTELYRSALHRAAGNSAVGDRRLVEAPSTWTFHRA